MRARRPKVFVVSGLAALGILVLLAIVGWDHVLSQVYSWRLRWSKTHDASEECLLALGRLSTGSARRALARPLRAAGTRALLQVDARRLAPYAELLLRASDWDTLRLRRESVLPDKAVDLLIDAMREQGNWRRHHVAEEDRRARAARPPGPSGAAPGARGGRAAAPSEGGPGAGSCRSSRGRRSLDRRSFRRIDPIAGLSRGEAGVSRGVGLAGAASGLVASRYSSLPARFRPRGLRFGDASLDRGPGSSHAGG